jgi:hypothetical protein
MTESDAGSITDLFLAGAHLVATAVAEEAVGVDWDRPSVLSEQSVGSLASHLARGGVWVVGDYLDGDELSGPVDFETAGEYYAAVLGTMTEEQHRAVRERAASVAAAGHFEVVATLRTKLDILEPRIRTVPADHLISVISGKVMRLGDYLATRIIEQVVHLDDLARSLDHAPWPVAEAATDLTVAVAGEIGSRRYGATAMIRALYRDGFAEPVLPVL